MDWVGLSITRTRTRNSNTTSRDTHFQHILQHYITVHMGIPDMFVVLGFREQTLGGLLFKGVICHNDTPDLVQKKHDTTGYRQCMQPKKNNKTT